jgi:hypothetical protein
VVEIEISFEHQFIMLDITVSGTHREVS